MHRPEAVFEVIKLTYISLTNKALLQPCLRGATQSQNEAFNAIMIWISGPNRDLLVLRWWSYQHIWLQPALIMELSPSWLLNARSGCTTGSFTDPVCNYAKMPGVRKDEVKASEKQKYRRKALRKSLKEKETF